MTSEQLVTAYIARVQEVNSSLNAVIEDRYEAALQDARLADSFIAKASTEFDRVALFTRYPLLGVPFTVKESCGLKGGSHQSPSHAANSRSPPSQAYPLPWAALYANR